MDRYTREGFDRYNAGMSSSRRCQVAYNRMSEMARERYKTIEGALRFCIDMQNALIHSFSSGDVAMTAKLANRARRHGLHEVAMDWVVKMFADSGRPQW
jgi:hypothetical protein